MGKIGVNWALRKAGAMAGSTTEITIEGSSFRTRLKMLIGYNIEEPPGGRHTMKVSRQNLHIWSDMSIYFRLKLSKYQYLYILINIILALRMFVCSDYLLINQFF